MTAPEKHEEHVNHERWLVSYADFTLLFAFIVVIFATPQTDKGKAKQVLRFGERSSGRVVPQGVEEKQKGKVVELMPSLAVLTGELSEEIESGKMQIQMGPRGLTIRFAQAALLPSGDGRHCGTSIRASRKSPTR
jgi:hypothetical protein